MNETKGVFEFNEKQKEIISTNVLITLFRILYKQKKISKEEYESLVLKTNRTFSLKK